MRTKREIRNFSIIFLGDQFPPKKIVLLKRGPDRTFGKNLYTGIGGKYDDRYKTLIDGALRELWEETGIQNIEIFEIGTVAINNKKIENYFFGIYNKDELPPCTDGELEWVHVEMTIKKAFVPTALILLKKWKRNSWNIKKPFSFSIERQDVENIFSPIISVLHQ